MGSAVASGLLVVVGFIVVLGLVFIGREVVAWYFKINESLLVLKNIDQSLWALLEVMKREEGRALDAIPPNVVAAKSE